MLYIYNKSSGSEIKVLTEKSKSLILATLNGITLDNMMYQLKIVMNLVESNKSKLLKYEFIAVHIKHEPDIAFTELCKDKDNFHNNKAFYDTYQHGQGYRGQRSIARQGGRIKKISKRGYIIRNIIFLVLMEA